MTTSISRRHWTSLEDSLLKQAVEKCREQLGTEKWRVIANHVPGRDRKACRKRWYQSIGATVKSGHWSPDEDARLTTAVQEHGQCWARVAEAVRTRNGDQCLKRWRDSLDPRLSHRDWTPEEDVRLEESVRRYGQNWRKICAEDLCDRSALAARHRYQVLGTRRSVARQQLVAGPFLFLEQDGFRDQACG